MEAVRTAPLTERRTPCRLHRGEIPAARTAAAVFSDQRSRDGADFEPFSASASPPRGVPFGRRLAAQAMGHVVKKVHRPARHGGRPAGRKRAPATIVRAPVRRRGLLPHPDGFGSPPPHPTSAPDAPEHHLPRSGPVTWTARRRMPAPDPKKAQPDSHLPTPPPRARSFSSPERADPKAREEASECAPDAQAAVTSAYNGEVMGSIPIRPTPRAVAQWSEHFAPQPI